MWWSLKMVCDMWKARGHNTELYLLLLILDSLVFLLSRDKTHSHTWGLHPPSCYCGVSFSRSIDLIWAINVEEEENEGGREGGRELLIFFESECGSIICFLEGVVVQKQPAGEPLPAVPNRNWERDALIKSPMKAFTHMHLHTHTHTHTHTYARLIQVPF